jgi:hypothetical protein
MKRPFGWLDIGRARLVPHREQPSADRFKRFWRD